MRQVIIIGGGLGGLISGIQLVRAGIPCLLIEKKSYPLHRVCGEYISNETVPFLEKEGLFPTEYNPPHIDELLLTSVTGKESKMRLPLGGFGISRYVYDNFLYTKAKEAGVEFMLDTEVISVEFKSDVFLLNTHSERLEAAVVIGAFGKRSKLDVQMKRAFISKRSPYLGVKYHIRTTHPPHQIALHNFDGGYCGINNVEGGISNLCYLTIRDNLQRFGSIEQMERQVLSRNKYLKHLFSDAEFLFDKPEVINEISFEQKAPVENHIVMVGDSAGMITPLCGNGMAIAIRSGKLAADITSKFFKGKVSRQQMESEYVQAWEENFKSRLWRGRKIQHLFGNKTLSNLAVNLVMFSRPLAKMLVRSTHGQPF